jgi:soluble lytic murein transglycosylase-like protein
MTIGQAIVTVALLAQMYGVDPALMQCIVERESNYATGAVNGPCVGLAQWNPDTRAWLAEKAAGDSGWLHGDIEPGPVQDVALFWLAMWIRR